MNLLDVTLKGKNDLKARLGLVVALRLILDVAYLAVADIFREYPPLYITVIRMTESWAFTLLAVLLLPSRWERPSRFYMSMLLLGLFVPMSVMYGYARFYRPYMYMVALTLVTMTVLLRIPLAPLYRIRGLASVTLAFAQGLVAFVFVWLVVTTGGRLTFELAALNAVRLETRETIFVGIWGYLIEWVAKVCVPLLGAMALMQRRHLAFAGVLILDVLLMGLTTHKSFLVSGLAPLALYWFWKSHNPQRRMLYLTLGVLLLVGTWYTLTGDIVALSLGIQRPLFKPGLLNFTYVEFFLDKPKVMLSSGFLGNFIDYPYHVNPSFLIGDYLKGSADTRSNTAFLGTGFAHFGLLGPLMFGVVVAGVIKLIDAAGRDLPLWVALSITFGPMVSLLISADLLPALNTHGVVLSIAVLWALQARRRERELSVSSGDALGP